MDPSQSSLPDGIGASLQSPGLRDPQDDPPCSHLMGEASAVINNHKGGDTPLTGAQPAVKVLLSTGDVIIEYVPPDSSPVSPENASHRWQVLSDDLMRNSPYFRALLDPNKFSEGRDFIQQKATWRQGTTTEGGESLSDDTSIHYTLPTVRLPVDHLPQKLGVDAIELFLQVLSFNSFEEEEKAKFGGELRIQPTSLVARLIELADAFNSPYVIREALKRSGYAFGKGRIPLSRFDSSALRLSEDRIRQTIFIARFLNEYTIFQIWTHVLILTGSKFWVNGVEPPTSATVRWRYLSDGLEGKSSFLLSPPKPVVFQMLIGSAEELYYRRQCVLNTITDLQAYFLRAFGALEEPEGPNSTTASVAVTAVQSRQYQCRCGFGNSSACDAFHLGQMTRFFTLRTKTIFLGSTLIDSDFGLDSEDEDRAERTQPAGLPSDVTAIISSLKQCPDYQIDTNHNGCGVRRRFLPPLDCIERFVGDARGLLGIELQDWDNKNWPSSSGSWANRSLRRARVIDIHLSRISSVPAMSSGLSRSSSQEENARLLFTAKKRNWEA
ncbi:hypothetical protein BDV24DRAFT_160954 [Aspergillus arachidicola]|uniref:Uncharacterized protein n=1 Tax=Aspergillus arachidicola TaxID=656916 RepID=A0A2G7FK48_9EURO|nr:hypothetical protein BDV24DRAFT_160954 [Aspergillus arachidicola]PIG80974.1 hypothetical protein AARAC_011013 [Aspergillus arachidicola]